MAVRKRMSQTNVCASAFKGKSGHMNPPEETRPGPGTYFEDEKSSLEAGGFQSNFKSHSSYRRILAAHPDLPASEVLEYSQNRAELNAPGPGAYDIPTPSEHFNSKGSSMFQTSRLGGKVESDGTGPGRYDPIYPKRSVPSATVAFKSESDRGGLNVPISPGPAFYELETEEKKSFLLNSKMRWV